jgi:hypothetical protein
MGHQKSREVVLALTVTDELLKSLDAMRDAWRRDVHSVPKGLSCSESLVPASSKASGPWV